MSEVLSSVSSKDDMSEVFISHSSKDDDFVKNLFGAMDADKEADKIGYWVDSEVLLPAEVWAERVLRGIEKARNFIFVISPNSIRSDHCKEELEWALKNGKRLIPIVIKEVDFQWDQPPWDELRARNYILFRPGVDDFQQSFEKLKKAIKTDLDWVYYHTWLQDRAWDWKGRAKPKGKDEGKGKDKGKDKVNVEDKGKGKAENPGRVLTLKDLQVAEERLSGDFSKKDPKPTPLQLEYVLASRKEATKRQRRILSAISIALVLVVGLAIVAFIQRGIAVNAEMTAVIERDQKATAQVKAQNAEGTAVVERDNKATAQVQAQNAERTAVAERDHKATAQVQAQNAEGTAVAERDLKATAQAIAETQRDLAISRQLAAQARSLATNQFDLGLLLAIEASRGSSDGILSLSSLLQAEPELVRIVSSAEGYIWQGADAGFIKSLALSADGNQLVAEPELGTPAAIFWDLKTGQSQPLDAGEYQRYLADWSQFQIPYPSLVSRQAEEQSLVPINPEETPASVKIILQTLEYNLFRGPSTAISNEGSTRAAFSACLTQPAAGGAPGCSSRIYVFEKNIRPLISKLASCSPTAKPSDFCVDLKDGKFCVKLNGGKFLMSDAQNTADQPPDFELYSVALQNEATGNGSKLTGVLYDSQHNWLITTAAVRRFGSVLALIVWDLDEKKQVFELFTLLWGNEHAALNYSNKSGAMDICGEDGTGVQVDLNPDSWQEKACKIAGRNLTQAEWKQFFGDKPYQQTCPQWPSEG